MNTQLGIALVLGAGVAAANGNVVDFENAPGSGNPQYQNVSYLDSSGFEFIGEHFHTMDNFAIANGLAENGSRVYIGHEGGNLGRAITMTKTGGGTFSVYSLDAAETWIGDNTTYPNAWGVSVTGYFDGGGSINAVLQLDGLLDGAGGIADFETFNLTGFTNLIAFEFNGVEATGAPNRAFGVDNINTVPAPGAMALLGLGGLMMRRRR